MAAFSYPASCHTFRCSSNRDNNELKQKLNNIRIVGASGRNSTEADTLSQTAGVANTFNSITNPVVENGCTAKEELRQNIPTKKHILWKYNEFIVL
jgi:hypothetical protein